VQAPPAPATAKSAAAKDVCNVAVLGASGYTGAEVVRLSALHPNIRITTLTGDRQAGKVSSEYWGRLVFFILAGMVAPAVLGQALTSCQARLVSIHLYNSHSQ
jgi:hypothetical protein